MKKISICIPTYNGEKYLKETLESISQQTYEDYEVIISDDSSTDNTLKIATEYSKTDKRIKIYKNSVNLGLVGNWNHCIKLAESEWIKFVFQDDTIEPRCLELMTQATKGGAEFVVCWREFLFDNDVDKTIRDIYLQGSTLERQFGKISHLDPTTLARACLTNPKNFIGEPTSTLFKKSITNKYGFFNNDFVQFCDFEYWVRIGLNTGIEVVPQTLANFRVHKNSTSAKNNSDNAFRSDLLDKLLLLHEYSYNPYFSILKNASKENGININLKKEFAKKAYWLKSKAYSNPVSGNRIPKT